MLRKISAAIVMGIIFTSISVQKVAAAEFKFIKIADNNDIGNFYVSALSAPAINDKGTVVINISDIRDSEVVPFSGRILASFGGMLTPIVPIRSFDSIVYTTPSINNNNEVVFYSQTIPTTGNQSSQIFTASRGKFNLIADTETFYNLNFPIINDRGTVVFSGDKRPGINGIFTSSRGVLTTVVDDSSFIYAVGRPVINNNGTVAFAATLDNLKDTSIFTVTNGIWTTIVDSSGSFNSLSSPDINDKGTVIFRTSLDAGGEGIFTITDGILTPIVTSNSFFKTFSEIALNNDGKVVFGATTDKEGFGIFTGTDSVVNKVIARDDILFGSKIIALLFDPQGFNNRGEIAFGAIFEDATQGYFVAIPVANVSEPTSLFSLVTAMSLIVLFRKKIFNKHKIIRWKITRFNK